jgi:two-component system, OmpR family, phosphate regulon sensor histidine kinase PhoR
MRIRFTRRIAIRCAAAAAVTAVAAGSLSFLFGLFWGIGGLVVLALLVAVLAFGFADRYITARLEEAIDQIVLIREQKFDRIPARPESRGDEIDQLGWQIHETALAVGKEIAELRKVENYRREFLGNVSHELKTPIFAIHGFAETLRDGALDDTRVNRSFVEKIIRNSDRLNELVRDLAEISRIETGQLKMNMEPFRLPRLCAEVVEGLELKASERQVSLESSVPSSAPIVVGDYDRIRQVLVNLVDNAIKYTNEGGRVELGASMAESGGLRVFVRDDGIGIAPEDLPRLTERFYRVDRSRSRDAGGTGLGLSIVKHILGAHGMTLIIESRPGEGAEFSFLFPAEAVRGGSTYVRSDLFRRNAVGSHASR